MSTVLIVGAGLAGLALAQALKKHNIPFKIFEKDERQDFRAQGYRLRIARDGILALQYALTPELWALFEKTTAAFDPAVPGARLDAISGEPLAAPSFQGGKPQGMQNAMYGDMQPYTVDRATMREVLLTELDDVHFGKEFKYYETSEDEVVAYFGDGSSYNGALLVGADGVWSRVRKQLLPNYSLIDTGMRIIYGKTPITPVFEKSIAQSLLAGMSLVRDKDTLAPKTMLLEAIRFPQADTISEFKLPHDYMYWVLVINKDLCALSEQGGSSMDHAQTAELSLSLSKDWDQSVRAPLEYQDMLESSILRIFSANPNMPAWEPSPKVTLLGDAIHAMPPTGGMGVNTALRGAGDLARRIVETRLEGTNADLIAQYEEDLRVFARGPLALSWQGGRMAFNAKPIEECEVISM
jgi:2-polyprenyl-6-methoxyphenol hydroxylase-like FAD-dependent oxidoreductase